MKKKNRILTESQKRQIIENKEKLIINSFTKTFNKIKRIDENEIPQTRLIVDNLSVDANGDFAADLTIMGIDSYIEGNLSDFEAVYSEPERQTYDYPGSPGGIEEVLYGDVKYNHLIFGDEFDSKKEEDVIAKLSSMAPNMIEMVNQAIEQKIYDMRDDGEFDTDEFLPSDPRDDMYENELEEGFEGCYWVDMSDLENKLIGKTINEISYMTKMTENKITSVKSYVCNSPKSEEFASREHMLDTVYLGINGGEVVETGNKKGQVVKMKGIGVIIRRANYEKTEIHILKDNKVTKAYAKGRDAAYIINSCNEDLKIKRPMDKLTAFNYGSADTIS